MAPADSSKRKRGGLRSKKLEAMLKTARKELNLLFEVGNALRTTLDFDQTLRIILTGVTSRAGLGFNRAAIFLVDEQKRRLEGRLGTGAEFHRAVTALKVPLSERAGGLMALSVLEKMPMEIVGREGRRKAVEDPCLRALESTSCVLVPLTSRDGSVVGLIFADNRITGQRISHEVFRLLALLAVHAGLAVENARLYETVRRQANLDPLTGLWNQGAFHRRLMEAQAEAEKTEQPFSLLLLDMDHFKEFNDRVGHLGGDEALKSVGRLLKETARAADTVARYGGEEFVILMPNTTKVNALKLAERIRLGMDRDLHGLTLSVGVATFPQDAAGAQSLLRIADRALYQAKNRGRDRVVLA